MKITANKICEVRMEINSAIDLLEDVFGDYEETAEAMGKLNGVVDFLYYLEKKARKEEK